MLLFQPRHKKGCPNCGNPDEPELHHATGDRTCTHCGASVPGLVAVATTCDEQATTDATRALDKHERPAGKVAGVATGAPMPSVTRRGVVPLNHGHDAAVDPHHGPSAKHTNEDEFDKNQFQLLNLAMNVFEDVHAATQDGAGYAGDGYTPQSQLDEDRRDVVDVFEDVTRAVCAEAGAPAPQFAPRFSLSTHLDEDHFRWYVKLATNACKGLWIMRAEERKIWKAARGKAQPNCVPDIEGTFCVGTYFILLLLEAHWRVLNDRRLAGGGDGKWVADSAHEAYLWTYGGIWKIVLEPFLRRQSNGHGFTFSGSADKWHTPCQHEPGSEHGRVRQAGKDRHYTLSLVDGVVVDLEPPGFFSDRAREESTMRPEGVELDEWVDTLFNNSHEPEELAPLRLTESRASAAVRDLDRALRRSVEFRDSDKFRLWTELVDASFLAQQCRREANAHTRFDANLHTRRFESLTDADAPGLSFEVWGMRMPTLRQPADAAQTAMWMRIEEGMRGIGRWAYKRRRCLDKSLGKDAAHALWGDWLEQDAHDIAHNRVTCRAFYGWEDVPPDLLTAALWGVSAPDVDLEESAKRMRRETAIFVSGGDSVFDPDALARIRASDAPAVPRLPTAADGSALTYEAATVQERVTLFVLPITRTAESAASDAHTEAARTARFERSDIKKTEERISKASSALTQLIVASRARPSLPAKGSTAPNPPKDTGQWREPRVFTGLTSQKALAAAKSAYKTELTSEALSRWRELLPSMDAVVVMLLERRSHGFVSWRTTMHAQHRLAPPLVGKDSKERLTTAKELAALAEYALALSTGTSEQANRVVMSTQRVDLALETREKLVARAANLLDVTVAALSAELVSRPGATDLDLEEALAAAMEQGPVAGASAEAPAAKRRKTAAAGASSSAAGAAGAAGDDDAALLV